MKKSLKVYDHIPMYSKRMLSVNYTPLQRKIVLEVQQTEIEKLAESFKLAGVWTHPGRRSKTFLKSMADSFNFLGFLFIPAPFLFSSFYFFLK